MDASGRHPDPLPPAVLAALQAAASPRKPAPAPHPQPESEESIAVHPALLRALVQGQQHQQPPWPGIDPNLRMPYPHGVIPQHAQSAAGHPYMYANVPGMPPGFQMHPQQLLALQHMHQMQLAQHTQHAGLPPPQHAYQMVHPPMDVDPPRDPFVYVQSEVKEAVDPVVMEGIKKRALFVAPPLPGGRLRIPQACERCRKRKTKCTGEKPRCRRCVKRGYECEYVFEHRANKTKKALADREKAEREAEEASRDQRMLVDPTMPFCPPLLAVAHSSSSGYSVPGTSSLPPPLMPGGPHGQHLHPLAAFAHASSLGYYGGAHPPVTPMPTPAIMVDGRPLPSPHMLPQTQTQPQLSGDIPASRSRSGQKAKRPSRAKSNGNLQAVSRSSSAMSLQQPEPPVPLTSAASCQACLAELAQCAACPPGRQEPHVQQPQAQQLQHHPEQPHSDIQRSRSTPEVIDLTTPRIAPPSPPPEVKQHLINVLTKVLAQKAAAEKAAAAGTSDKGQATTTPMPTPVALPPLLAPGGSSSSSGSEMKSGMQTPQDYFAHPAYAVPGPSVLSPAVYSPGMVKTSESMAMANAGQGMYLPSPGIVSTAEPGCSRDGEGGLRFSDYFHSFEPSSSDSMQSVEEY
ncbi:hypothetical protein OH77DRAFT_1584876 [Trametes cingulata]|nr:hypothetical protein OH77DRAFT_1584876 [Trametes cingulata]